MTTPIEGNDVDVDAGVGTGVSESQSESEPGAGSETAASLFAPEVSRPEDPPPLVSDPAPKSNPESESTSGAVPATASATGTDIAAAASEKAEKPRPFQALIDLLHDLAIAVVVCVLLITYVVQAFKVQGTSMTPELGDGERILVNKFLYRFGAIDRGDVVVFWYPEDPTLSFIKRVVGLPGETVEIRGGVVYLDGVAVDEAYVSENNEDHRDYPPTSIRPGHYFVLGDNRRGSNDSRSWGFVPERYIYGKAFLRIWPLEHFGSVQ